MKSKLLVNNYRNSLIYSESSLMWAFVHKKEKDYELLHSFLQCKDYMHEIISNSIHDKLITLSHGASLFDININNVQIALLVKDKFKNADALKKILYSAKNIFSRLEIKYNLPKTLIKEIACQEYNSKVFIITVKKHHIESPVLLHSLIALLRTIVVINKIVNEKNIIKILEESTVKDYMILRYLFKHNLLNILLQKHKELFEDINLKDIYPKLENIQKGTSYHSGFGPVALQRKCICSKTYSDKLYPLIGNIEK